MAEFEVDGVIYRLESLSAVQEWNFYTLLVPVLPMMTRMEVDLRAATVQGRNAMDALLPIADVPDQALLDLFATVRSFCRRKLGDGWVEVDRDLPMASLISLLMTVSHQVLNAFFTFKPTKFKPASRDGATYESVRMTEGKDWLFRPVLRHLCRAESLWDGTLHLAQIAELNDALAVGDENEFRARRAAEREAERARAKR